MEGSRAEYVSKPKQHHTVPASFLRAFTAEDAKDGTLYVWDLQKERSFTTSPSKAARQRDFYRIDDAADEDEALIIEERFLANLEGEFVSARRRVIEVPTILIRNADIEAIFQFIALQYVRTQRLRSTVEAFDREIRRLMLAEYTATKDRFEVLRSHAAKAGLVNMPSLEEFQEFARTGYVPSGMSQNMKLVVMLDAFETALILLRHRLWCLVKTVSSPDRFIVSDNPVNFAWRETQMGGLFSPGFGTLNSQLIFPMAPQLAWVSIHEDEVTNGMASSVIDAKWRTVAQQNGVQLRSADRFVYSSTPEFDWMDDDGTILGSDVLFENRGTQCSREQAGDPKSSWSWTDD